jgi:dTDP-4-dehydrorhamnose reductase
VRTLLVTGWGLVAQALAHVATQDGLIVHATSRRAAAGCGTPLDLAESSAALEEIVRRARPDAVVHTAARTGAAACQSDPAGAFRDNVAATENVLRAAQAEGVPVVFLSTDAVFDGTRGGYREDDRRGPVNVYALTKAHAEDLVRSAGGLVVRATYLGRRPDGGAGLVERLLDRDARVSVPAGKRASPLWVGDAMRVLLELLEREARGVVHVGSSDAIGWADLATTVRGAVVEEAPPADGVPRPRDTSLDVSRAVALTGRLMPTVADTVSAMLAAPALQARAA